jgi:hypothetical protein
MCAKIVRFLQLLALWLARLRFLIAAQVFCVKKSLQTPFNMRVAVH